MRENIEKNIENSKYLKIEINLYNIKFSYVFNQMYGKLLV